MDMPAGVEVYQPGTDGDAPLLQWYSVLVETGDLAELVGPSLFPLAAFMKNYTAPDTRVLFVEDDKGWTAVAWLSVFMGGGTWGLWVRKNHARHSGSRKIMAFIMSSLAYAFEHVPVLVNTTRRGSVVAKTCRLGYNYVGEIPHLFEGETCHILYMTREMFQPIWEKWQTYLEQRHESK